MKYQVERGVKPRTGPGLEANPIDYPFAQMEAGDSFHVDCENTIESRGKEQNRVYRQAKRYARESANYAFRVTLQAEEGGFRVWRDKDLS